MNTGEIVGAVVAAVGVVVTIVIFLIQRRGHRAQEARAEEQAALAREAAEREKDAARPKLSAEYLDGPTEAPAPFTSGFQFRYRVINHGSQPARDPRAEIIDAATGKPVEPNGASLMGTDGLLRSGAEAQAMIVVPSLKRPMRLSLSWYAYEDMARRTHISRAPVPRSEQEAATVRSAYRGGDGRDSGRRAAPS